MTTTTITPTPTPSPTTDEADRKQLRKVRKVIASKTFATLATTSPAGRPHVSGVLYDEVEGALWVHTMRSSRKARSIAANRHVAVTIPFRRLPVGPPYTVQFQATAELVEMDDTEVVDLIAAGALKTVSAHGALDEPDGVFVRITPGRTVHSYGLGANPIDLVRDPLHTGARTVHLDDGEHRR